MFFFRVLGKLSAGRVSSRVSSSSLVSGVRKGVLIGKTNILLSYRICYLFFNKRIYYLVRWVSDTVSVEKQRISLG